MLHQYFRKAASNPFISALLVTTILSLPIVSCTNTANSDVVASTTSKYSGEDLFRGIFFMQGEAANHIESYQVSIEKLKSYDSKIITRRNELANDIVNGIKKIDPSFFERFEKELKSNNLYEINNSIQYAGELTQNVVLKSVKYGKYFSYAQKVIKKVDVNKYDLSKPEDVEKLKGDIKNQVEADRTEEDSMPDDVEVVAAAFAVVVVAVIWEVAAAVNAAVLVNFWGLAFVRTKIYASTGAFPQKRFAGEQTAHDIFIGNVSDLAHNINE